ncbi:type II toxin-antitoxin system Phd/YefM family antitoxin [Phyllobacterium lublinensis]|uniref:type II toxin-antitoxin system Phd/YefM family antitoxin n=1 Tax=Phyllobacterium lublinensis TaxID=2875708 RepID=UPI001CCD6F41|nr:type II toxin-antitoxin system prevent-host-death family antitoxin [Phyllobacterium sp. 2063]MBZ9656669.1 type II toxin-antitoxin system prevent-host-death family antitoxin [Phyllobacterium sp. 2063]
MRTINIREVKTHLSRLVEQVANGEPFVIAKAGKSIAKVVPLDKPAANPQRFGFMAGQIKVPADFDSMGRIEIERICGGRE